MDNLTVSFNAYVAGFFDGEGNVQLTRRGAKRQRIQYAIKITNTNLRVLEEIRSAFGGTISVIRKETATSQEVYRLSLTSRERIQYFLFNVMPFLRLKLPQARLLSAFLQRRQHSRVGLREAELCEKMLVVNSQSRKRAA